MVKVVLSAGRASQGRRGCRCLQIRAPSDRSCLSILCFCLWKLHININKETSNHLAKKMFVIRNVLTEQSISRFFSFVLFFLHSFSVLCNYILSSDLSNTILRRIPKCITRLFLFFFLFIFFGLRETRLGRLWKLLFDWNSKPFLFRAENRTINS